MMEKIMVVAPTTAVPIKHGLGCSFERCCLRRRWFQHFFGAFEIYVDVVVLL